MCDLGSKPKRLRGCDCIKQNTETHPVFVYGFLFFASETYCWHILDDHYILQLIKKSFFFFNSCSLTNLLLKNAVIVRVPRGCGRKTLMLFVLSMEVLNALILQADDREELFSPCWTASRGGRREDCRIGIPGLRPVRFVSSGEGNYRSSALSTVFIRVRFGRDLQLRFRFSSRCKLIALLSIGYRPIFFYNLVIFLIFFHKYVPDDIL